MFGRVPCPDSGAGGSRHLTTKEALMCIALEKRVAEWKGMSM